MIPRFPGPFTSMNRSLALLCLIGLDRSRVIMLSLARDRLFLYYIIRGTVFLRKEMGWETGCGKEYPHPCRLRTVPLLAVLIGD